MQNETPFFEFRGPFGVPVQINPSLIMLFVIIVVIGGGNDILWSLTFFIMLVISIFLHELGHAWGYLIQGLPVRNITLHGGGGYCQGVHSATPYEEELVVAMGPIVNLILWAVCGLISEFAPADSYEIAMVLSYLGYFATLNLYLAIFNLIPVHPLDGGKLFHLFAMRLTSYEIATRISGAVGTVLSVLWIPAALWFYFTNGWFLFFFPSIIMHYNMFRNKRA
ncbi:hypothetical protein F9L33_03095 [Amylibacter sp. SFDW26]|uniref:site-2 protease family protein n=1 Tax=Amylibacter sp. SFDW26 TaxID=2652722 RepID=UPI0012626686|nr:site-2 protease family protein [Amylibacter sp. SFDW26]KAB7615762.1 hypothetical protein F9L33_03095 [Amylibacter sp. SFDW26]